MNAEEIKEYLQTRIPDVEITYLDKTSMCIFIDIKINGVEYSYNYQILTHKNRIEILPVAGCGGDLLKRPDPSIENLTKILNERMEDIFPIYFY